MNSERLKALKRFASEDPEDPFNHYALALEWMKTDPAKADQTFDFLLARFPTYVPAYYQAACLKISLNMTDEAVRIIETGTVEAGRQKSTKAVNELRSLLDEIA
ncbi:MAG: tetratricopeptide repeat protein [Bacteroidetes bacterium]|nr:tetratricopeptide repeat protein [Bacteroidota bacterium]